MTRSNRLPKLWLAGACRILTVLAVVTAFPMHADAINYSTGAKLREGFYLNLYPYWYTAGTKTDKNGNAATNSLGMDKYGIFIGGSYYIGDVVLNAIVPFGQLEIGAAKERDGGLGDIQLRGGYFLPVKEVTILPALAIKVPSGSFDKNRKVNLGDGQADIMAELYLFKLFDGFSVDWLFKYSKRLRNHDTDMKPGDEFATEGLVTYKLTDTVRLGPSTTFLVGGDSSKSGLTLSASGVLRFAVGGEVFYRGFPQAKLSLAVLKDVYTQNTSEGILTMSRITIPF